MSDKDNEQDSPEMGLCRSVHRELVEINSQVRSISEKLSRLECPRQPIVTLENEWSVVINKANDGWRISVSTNDPKPDVGFVVSEDKDSSAASPTLPHRVVVFSGARDCALRHDLGGNRIYSQVLRGKRLIVTVEGHNGPGKGEVSFDLRLNGTTVHSKRSATDVQNSFWGIIRYEIDTEFLSEDHFKFTELDLK